MDGPAEKIEFEDGGRPGWAEGVSMGVLSLPFPHPDGCMQMVECLPCAADHGSIVIRGGTEMVAVMALAAGNKGDLIGIYAPLTARDLRERAAAMLKMADYLDRGKGKQ